MPYAIIYDPAYPDGATFPANEIDTAMKTIEAMFVERIQALWGVNFTNDPMLITKLGLGVNVNNKLTYEPEYDGGNSGATKTLDFVISGTTQKFTLTAACVFTFPTAPAGTKITLHLVQNAVGGWIPTFSANVNYASNTAPVLITTALSSMLLGAYSNGSVWYLYSAGSAFDVS